MPDGAGPVVHVLSRTKNADPQARIGAQSLPGSPAIIRHAELQSPRALFSFPNACTTHPPARQRIRLALRWVQPARIRVRPALRSRGVRTPLPLSAARTRPGGSREQRGGRMAPLRWGVRESPSAVAGTDGKQPGRAAGSPPHRRKKCPLTPEKRPGPARSEAGDEIMQLKKQRPVSRRASALARALGQTRGNISTAARRGAPQAARWQAEIPRWCRCGD